MLVCDVNITTFSDDEIASLFIDLNTDKFKAIRRLLLVLSDNKDARTKNIALRCLKYDYPDLKITAFKVLNNIKNDSEIEQFFIDYLVEDTDKHSMLRMIASSYWD